MSFSKKVDTFVPTPLQIRDIFIFCNIFLPKPSDIAWVYLANTWGFHEVANFQSLKFFYQSQVHGMSINLCKIVYINSGKKLNSFYFCMSASCLILESLRRVLSFICFTIFPSKTQRYRVGLPCKYLRCPIFMVLKKFTKARCMVYLYITLLHTPSVFTTNYIIPIFISFITKLKTTVTERQSHCISLIDNATLPVKNIKGTVSRDFFSWISFLKAIEYLLGPFQIFSKICVDNRRSRCTTGVTDSSGK